MRAHRGYVVFASTIKPFETFRKALENSQLGYSFVLLSSSINTI